MVFKTSHDLTTLAGNSHQERCDQQREAVQSPEYRRNYATGIMPVGNMMGAGGKGWWSQDDGKGGNGSGG